MTGACMFWMTDALAAYNGPVHPGSKDVAVEDVRSMADDERVTLEGYVVGQLRGEHYLFRDASGEIDVEIDKEVWRNIEADQDTRFRLSGEVDHDKGSVSIDVYRLEQL